MLLGNYFRIFSMTFVFMIVFTPIRAQQDQYVISKQGSKMIWRGTYPYKDTMLSGTWLEDTAAMQIHPLNHGANIYLLHWPYIVAKHGDIRSLLDSCGNEMERMCHLINFSDNDSVVSMFVCGQGWRLYDYHYNLLASFNRNEYQQTYHGYSPDNLLPTISTNYFGAPVSYEKCALMDRNGNWITMPVFDYIEGFDGASGKAGLNGKKGIVDREGNFTDSAGSIFAPQKVIRFPGMGEPWHISAKMFDRNRDEPAKRYVVKPYPSMESLVITAPDVKQNDHAAAASTDDRTANRILPWMDPRVDSNRYDPPNVQIVDRSSEIRKGLPSGYTCQILSSSFYCVGYSVLVNNMPQQCFYFVDANGNKLTAAIFNHIFYDTYEKGRVCAELFTGVVVNVDAHGNVYFNPHHWSHRNVDSVDVMMHTFYSDVRLERNKKSRHLQLNWGNASYDSARTVNGLRRPSDVSVNNGSACRTVTRYYINGMVVCKIVWSNGKKHKDRNGRIYWKVTERISYRKQTGIRTGRRISYREWEHHPF